jgi:diketogulonate reductase-like aldo/keto reductase
LTRAHFLGLAAGAVAASGARAQTEAKMLTRPIPSTGEQLPVVGVGTWRTFDVGASAAERAPLAEVLRALVAAGGSVIDSSPMYGRSEAVVGDLLAADPATRARVFLATKVWTQGREAGVDQMTLSMTLLKAAKLDLMQVHNLVDWRTHLATLRAWKAEGRIRYVGVTHYTEGALDELERVLRAERLDFVQLSYAADDRAAERRVLPLAAERGVAVLVNQPFGGGGLIRKLRDRPLPAFAAEIGCASWAQLLLKFLLGNPAVTCVIPGTSRPEHMRDNVRAGFGALPDAAMRERIARAVAA